MKQMVARTKEHCYKREIM